MNRAQNTKNRILTLNKAEIRPGNVVYWMSRDQRINYNHALLCAQEFAIQFKSKLYVIFNVVPEFLGATYRQYSFMLGGLKKLESELKNYNIIFKVLLGNPEETINKFIRKHDISLLITDFDPLRVKRTWKSKISKSIDVPFLEVDTHNIVPAFYVSAKKELGAFTFRRKILNVLNEFLVSPGDVIAHPFNNPREVRDSFIDWEKVDGSLKVDRTVGPVDLFEPGERHAQDVLKRFINHRLYRYHLERNNPMAQAISDLSPYLHFGHISSLEVALRVMEAEVDQYAKEVFLEQLIIRKELSDNFCLYEENYDNIEGLPAWGKESLEKHKKDVREYIYNLEAFEHANTHDPLWNAAQRQMLKEGKMHGYMRMYWAKKILEWSESPEAALEISIYLNDKYELDGRDPNGYTGILWSIGGLHDRPWKERPIFGKIRYMSYNGLRRKFDVNAYIMKYSE